MAAFVFTGLVSTQGQLLARSPRGNGFQLAFAHDLGQLELGESIAVNGACLTAKTCHAQRFEADVSAETAARTTLGRLPIGGSVHLERALRAGDRLGGHIVTGHVDAVARLLELGKNGEGVELAFELPTRLAPFIAEKGSVALDGVSLTVNRVMQSNFSVMVVPYTQQATHLGTLRSGDNVNLEVDILARYVANLARVGTVGDETREPGQEVPDRDASLRKALGRAGLL
jgi:riboflavin synthase